ncbi:MAG TPA: LacI family DNA-binding transcriptional regulator [Candidatus Eremiobacteraceae bacterium]|jgi:LacI family transcriptional regulator|nr:LacI family DNA-binding transcriptional regulator [Candidatus Eremiobacteraceae bacterium]
MDIREIAKRAKVSTATVSRTINRVPTVDPALAKRVMKVVEDMGYYPNTAARALVSGKSRIFGLIVSEITNPFFPEIVQAFEDLAVQNHYEILLTSTVHDPKRMELAVRRMIERRVDGVAILTFGMEDALIEDLRFRKVPLVFVDVGPHLAGVTNIRVNYQQGIREAVKHLAKLGHKRIAFVAGPTNLKSAMARRTAFEESMQENGLTVEPELIVTGDHKVEGGVAALAQLAGLPKRPTAILCSNDMTAVGVMREAYDRGITIPRELSVIGFDDIRLAEFTTPPLTTVRMSQKQLAEYAFQALHGEVEGRDGSENGKEVELETSLILRGSTAKVPA